MDTFIAPAKHSSGATGAAFCFHTVLTALLPRLRVQALALTRNGPDADDLVQAAVTNALAAQSSFTPGTNFGAWMYRIMRNRFLSDRRRVRDTVEMDDAPPDALAMSANQEDNIALGELRREMARLPADQRVALMMVVVQGLSYEQVAEAMECAVGTAKCRVFRARHTLKARLLSAEADAINTADSRKARSSRTTGSLQADENRARNQGASITSPSSRKKPMMTGWSENGAMGCDERP